MIHSYTNSLTPSKGLTAEQLEIGGPKPPSKDAIVEWFRSSELARRAGLEPHRNIIAPWFHGKLLYYFYIYTTNIVFTRRVYIEQQRKPNFYCGTHIIPTVIDQVHQ